MRQFLTCLAALVVAVVIVQLSPSGVARACAQVPQTPDLIPQTLTVGPVDPACQRVPDTDKDGVFDIEDNCHRYFNPKQVDTDGDAGPPPYEPVPINYRDPTTGGDSCDVDDDGDGVLDAEDVCPKNADPDQKDTDGDGVGDACDDATAVAGAVPAAPAPDLRLSVAKLPRRVRREEMRAGLSVAATCTAACALQAEIKVGRTKLGEALGGLAARGRTYLFVKLTPAAKKRIAKRRKVNATIRVVASDDTGHTRTVTRKITLLR